MMRNLYIFQPWELVSLLYHDLIPKTYSCCVRMYIHLARAVSISDTRFIFFRKVLCSLHGIIIKRLIASFWGKLTGKTVRHHTYPTLLAKANGSATKPLSLCINILRCESSRELPSTHDQCTVWRTLGKAQLVIQVVSWRTRADKYSGCVGRFLSFLFPPDRLSMLDTVDDFLDTLKP